MAAGCCEFEGSCSSLHPRGEWIGGIGWFGIAGQAGGPPVGVLLREKGQKLEPAGSMKFRPRGLSLLAKIRDEFRSAVDDAAREALQVIQQAVGAGDGRGLVAGGDAFGQLQ